MRSLRVWFWALAALLLAASPLAADPHPLAAQTLVLANAEDTASVDIARAYQTARGLPDENVLLLPLSGKLTISREEFVRTLWNPLRQQLVERALILGGATAEEDAMGRRKLLINGARFRYLVLCRGVPLKVGEAAELADSAPASVRLGAEENWAERFPEQLRKNQASVDSELALLLYDDMPVGGILPNPLFQKLPPPPEVPVVRVTRLDGPSVASVLRMIRDALHAERFGLRGRAYFDLAARSGRYKAGDDWISRAAELARAADFEVTVDHGGKPMDIDARFDAPALYFGWYASDIGGVFGLPELYFPPGAVVAHLHSFSASNLRDAQRGWVGPLVERGVTATVGNVFEPYLEQTHHFDILLEGLLAGMNFGDAAYAAVPSLSWQAVAVGDPLYQPFALGLPEQVAQLGDPATAMTDPYVVSREMNRLTREESAESARAVGLRGIYRTPGPSLALKLAELDLASGDTAAALRRLQFAPLVKRFSGPDWILFDEIARRLREWGDAAAATRVYAHLLADERLPKRLRLRFLEQGVQAAQLGREFQLAIRWRQAWNELQARP